MPGWENNCGRAIFTGPEECSVWIPTASVYQCTLPWPTLHPGKYLPMFGQQQGECVTPNTRWFQWECTILVWLIPLSPLKLDRSKFCTNSHAQPGSRMMASTWSHKGIIYVYKMWPQPPQSAQTHLGFSRRNWTLMIQLKTQSKLLGMLHIVLKQWTGSLPPG